MSVYFINPINAFNLEHSTQLFTYAYWSGFRSFFFSRYSVLILTKNWLPCPTVVEIILKKMIGQHLRPKATNVS
jgi:hypothetical protein